jgi:hypothetical protein
MLQLLVYSVGESADDEEAAAVGVAYSIPESVTFLQTQ